LEEYRDICKDGAKSIVDETRGLTSCINAARAH